MAQAATAQRSGGGRVWSALRYGDKTPYFLLYLVFFLLHAALAPAAGIGFLLFRLTVWRRHGAQKGLQSAAPSA